LPLPCEAISFEDFTRVEHKPVFLAKLKEQYNAQEIFLLGLAILVITTSFENRKKYDVSYLGRALFSYLRAGRVDIGYKKRIIALLHEVLRGDEHFSTDDLQTMFGDEIAETLRVLALPMTTDNFALISAHPLAYEIYEYVLRAHIDWAQVVGDSEGEKESRRALNLLISLREQETLQ
jgi:hypothetical protein